MMTKRRCLAALAATLLAGSAAAQPDLKIQDRHPAYASDPLPEPKLVRTIPITPGHTFEERWEPVRELLAQQERRRAMAEPPAEQNAPAAVPAPLPRQRPAIRPAKLADVGEDICTRHGRRKVWQGRSWRCR
jgi:hypothetical protein